MSGKRTQGLAVRTGTLRGGTSGSGFSGWLERTAVHSTLVWPRGHTRHQAAVTQPPTLIGGKRHGHIYTGSDSTDGPGARYAEWNKPVREKTNTIWSHSYVESNEQTELTSNIETDSQMESRLTASGGVLVKGWRDWEKGKRTHGHGQQCGDCRGEGSIEDLNGNGKNTIHFLKGKKKWQYGFWTSPAAQLKAVSF